MMRNKKPRRSPLSLFPSSTTVHFAHFLTTSIANTLDPCHSVYNILPRYCPLAYHSDKNF